MPIYEAPYVENPGVTTGKALRQAINDVAQYNRQRAVQQEEQRHQQEMLDRAYAQQAALQRQEAEHQRQQLELAYRLESDRQREAELHRKQQLEKQLRANQLKQQKMITAQREYEQKVEVLTYFVLGLSVIAIVLVMVVIFKRKKP